MSGSLTEQRNPYKGKPPHPWIRVRLVGPNGAEIEMDLVADTGNPVALILDPRTMAQFRHGVCASLTSNFGTLDGGWVRVIIPETNLDLMLVGFGSNTVAATVQQYSPDFVGLLGLPVLRMMEYGGDQYWFWIRPAMGVP